MHTHVYIWLQEEFEDTKGAIRIRISEKNRQHNSQKKKYKRTNNDLHNITQKTKDPHEKPEYAVHVNVFPGVLRDTLGLWWIMKAWYSDDKRNIPLAICGITMANPVIMTTVKLSKWLLQLNY
jgi:hypothetical protein